MGEAKSGFRVLVIDDSEIDREITTRHLGKAWPFERELILDYAADGTEALDKMRTARYALFVLDWKLPGMGGGEMVHVENFAARGEFAVVLRAVVGSHAGFNYCRGRGWTARLCPWRNPWVVTE